MPDSNEDITSRFVAAMTGRGWRYVRAVNEDHSLNEEAMRIGSSIYPTLISPDGMAKVALSRYVLYYHNGNVWRMDSTYSEPDLILLEGLVVDPSVRRSGVGTRAVEELLSAADATGARLMGHAAPMGMYKAKGQRTIHQNRLIQWYLSLGFVPAYPEEGRDLLIYLPSSRKAGNPPKLNAAFWRWFGKSVVRNEDGSPRVVYHGTSDPLIHEFRMDMKQSDYGDTELGFFFSGSKEVAGKFGGKMATVECFLSIKNPYIMSGMDYFEIINDHPLWWSKDFRNMRKSLIEKGYDGIIVGFDETIDREFGPGWSQFDDFTYIAFFPWQIKSVDNDGTWDADGPDIASNPPGQSEREMAVAFDAAMKDIFGQNQIVWMTPFVFIGDKKGGILGRLEVHFKPAVDWTIDGVKYHQTSTLHIGYIGVGRADRRKGYGTRLMEALVRIADLYGWDMDGTIDPQKEEGDIKPPMTARQLLRFYQKFGFELVPKYVSLIERKHKMG